MRTLTKPGKSHPYITSRKEICGGSPCISGTRIPVWSLIKWYKAGFTIEDITREFPQLSPSQVHDAFSYYYDHQDKIEKEIGENEDEAFWKKLLKTRHA